MARIASLTLVALTLLVETSQFVLAAPPEAVPSTVETAATDALSNDWDKDDSDFTPLAEEAMRKYLEAPQDSRQVKRLAIDALVLATVVGDATKTNRIKTDLLQRYPSSVETAYVLTTFADGKKLREFLDAQFLKELTDTQKAQVAVRAIRLAFPKYQKELLEDQGFALRLARAAFMANDVGMCNECRKVLKDNNARVATLACDDLTPIEKRFSELQELSLKDEFAALSLDITGFQKHLLTLMTVEERTRPEIRRIVARNYLNASELAHALVEFEFLKDAIDDPQIRFQHGVCLARMRRSDEARSVFKQLISKFADSPWRTSAETTLGLMEDLDSTIEKHAELLTEIIRAYRENKVEIFDMELCWNQPNGDVITVTVGIDLIQNKVEVVATKNETPLFGFLGNSAETNIYIKGEPAIIRLPKMSLLPNVQIDDGTIDKTGFHGNTKITTGNSMSGLRKTCNDLLHNEQLTSKATMTLLMTGMVQMGRFPLALETNEGSHVVRIQTVEIDQPSVSNFSLTVDAAHHLKSAEYHRQNQHFEIRRLILGKWSDHRLVEGNWPKIPTNTLAENDFPTLMRLFAAGLQLATGEMKKIESTANNAGQGTVPLR